MKPIPSVLLPAYARTLMAASVENNLKADYEKWLRYYLDFCFKYQHPPRDPDSLPPFLQKLAAKNQTKANQMQATHSVTLYYDTMKNWPTPEANSKRSAHGDWWLPVFQQLKEEINIRQYSTKTLKTYRIWIEQFKKYLNDKVPGEVNADITCIRKMWQQVLTAFLCRGRWIANGKTHQKNVSVRPPTSFSDKNN